MQQWLILHLINDYLYYIWAHIAVIIDEVNDCNNDYDLKYYLSINTGNDITLNVYNQS